MRSVLLLAVRPGAGPNATITRRGRALAGSQGQAGPPGRLVRRGMRLVAGAYRSPSASAPWSARPRIGFESNPYAAITKQNATAPSVDRRVRTGRADPRRASSRGLWR